jgi:phage terminase large subunit
MPATKQLSLEEQIEIALKVREIYLPIPHLFVKDVCGATTWFMQDEIVKSVFANKITAVKTCNAVGKSYIAARVALAFLTLHPNSIVVTTAPTWRQVKDVLWREFAVAVKRSKFPLTTKEVKQAGLDISEDWFAVGLSTTYPENFFGYHADHILVIVDEAGGVDEPIFKGVAAITPNINARVLLIGNPTSPSGTFFDMFDKPALGATCFTISAFDSPNFISTGIRDVETLLKVFTAPLGQKQSEWITAVNKELQKRMDPTFSALIDPSVVFGRYHEFGPDSPAWQALVLGEFPSQSEQALFPTNLVTMAMEMDKIEPAYFDPKTKTTRRATYAEICGWTIPDGPQEYGLDMARFGSDKTVFTPRRGGHVEKQHVWGGYDLIESADRVIKTINPHADVTIKIDDTGNGGGTTDALNRYKNQRNGQAPYNYQVIPYQMASSQVDKVKFHDLTSEIYWNLSEWFTNHQISIPFDQELRDELIARRWSLTPAGRIKVESKDEYKKRTGGKSPDKSDSLALAFARSKSLNTVQQKPLDNQAINTLQPKQAPITSGLRQRF